jgi:hypothetical protein
MAGDSRKGEEGRTENGAVWMISFFDQVPKAIRNVLVWASCSEYQYVNEHAPAGDAVLLTKRKLRTVLEPTRSELVPIHRQVASR